jgi:hypothetical protein
MKPEQDQESWFFDIDLPHIKKETTDQIVLRRWPLVGGFISMRY